MANFRIQKSMFVTTMIRDQFDKSQLQLVQRRKSIDGTIIPTYLIVYIRRKLIRHLILGVKMKRV